MNGASSNNTDPLRHARHDALLEDDRSEKMKMFDHVNRHPLCRGWRTGAAMLPPPTARAVYLKLESANCQTPDRYGAAEAMAMGLATGLR